MAAFHPENSLVELQWERMTYADTHTQELNNNQTQLNRSVTVCVCCSVVFLPSASELSKHKRYEIRMSVYNAVGEGPSSPPQEVFVGEAGV